MKYGMVKWQERHVICKIYESSNSKKKITKTKSQKKFKINLQKSKKQTLIELNCVTQKIFQTEVIWSCKGY